ncbi:MAG: hypothetical protein ACETWQ_04645 [Phycisphaerae bacterium]
MRILKLMLVQSDICGFVAIQPILAWIIKAERVGAVPCQDGQAQFLPGYGGLRPDE